MTKFFWNYLYLKPSFVPERLAPIEEALEWQEWFLRQKSESGDRYNFILFAEHEPIYTYPPKIAEVLEDQEKRKKYLKTDFEKFPAPLFKLPDNHGGSITYHGPGQLVCYLIVDLHDLKCEVAQIGQVIDDAIQTVLTALGIKGYSLRELINLDDKNIAEQLVEQGVLRVDRKGNKYGVVAAGGVWVVHGGMPKKIASRGIKLKFSNRFTTYGFALNVSTDLSYFDAIYPCGLNLKMTSVEQIIGKRHSLPKVAKMLAEALVKKFREISDDEMHELI